jgi:hypothetical protein
VRKSLDNKGETINKRKEEHQEPQKSEKYGEIERQESKLRNSLQLQPWPSQWKGKLRPSYLRVSQVVSQQTSKPSYGTKTKPLTNLNSTQRFDGTVISLE